MNDSTPSRCRQRRFRRAAWRVLVLAGAGAVGMTAAACSSAGKTYDTPDAAAQALATALRADDLSQIREVLGSEGEEIVSSGDEVEDRRVAEHFLSLYDEQHKVVADGEEAATLVVGHEDWPLPIPLIRQQGGWQFDTPAGLQEIAARRVGRNELATIEVCRAIVDAQREYAAGDPNGNGAGDYAVKFLSDPGKRNGLFYPTAEGEPESPLGELAAEAWAEGYRRPENSQGPSPYHGYYYRLLTAQGPFAPGGPRNYLEGDRLAGGFAVVAYPATYGNSGIMTFLVARDGVVYQRDLGDSTKSLAEAMTVYNPDPDWDVVDEHQ